MTGVVMAALAIIGVIGQGLVGAFRAGRQTQRLDQAEANILQLGQKVEGIGTLQIGMATLAANVANLQGEVGRMAVAVQSALNHREG